MCKIIFHYLKKKLENEASIILLNDVGVISCKNHSKCKIEVLEFFDHVTAHRQIKVSNTKLS